MGKYNDKQYQIDHPQSDQLFLKARQIAGLQIQEQFRIHNRGKDVKSSFDGFKWLKSELTYPSFDTFSFAYKSTIFSVFIEMITNGDTSFTENSRKLLLDECSKYNLLIK